MGIFQQLSERGPLPSSTCLIEFFPEDVSYPQHTSHNKAISSWDLEDTPTSQNTPMGNASFPPRLAAHTR
jgi:hypothetical protein